MVNIRVSDGFMSEKLSELVEKLEKENTSYKRLIRKCILIDDKFFDDNINDFMVLHLNRTLSYCPFPGFCKYFNMCMETSCNCDVCDNGYPRRF